MTKWITCHLSAPGRKDLIHRQAGADLPWSSWRFKLQSPSLAQAPSNALGGVINKYSLSYLISYSYLFIYLFCEKGPQNYINFRPYKTWIHPWPRALQDFADASQLLLFESNPYVCKKRLWKCLLVRTHRAHSSHNYSCKHIKPCLIMHVLWLSDWVTRGLPWLQ